MTSYHQYFHLGQIRPFVDSRLGAAPPIFQAESQAETQAGIAWAAMHSQQRMVSINQQPLAEGSTRRRGTDTHVVDASTSNQLDKFWE